MKPFEQNSKHLHSNSNPSNEIWRIWMQILTMRMEIRTIRRRFQKHSITNSNRSKGIRSILNHSKGIRGIQIQIQTIGKGFIAFECKFKQFKGIRSIRIQIWTIRKGLKHSNPNSNDLKRIRSIRMQILIIRTKFKAFECKFEPFERD